MLIPSQCYGQSESKLKYIGDQRQCVETIQEEPKLRYFISGDISEFLSLEMRTYRIVATLQYG